MDRVGPENGPEKEAEIKKETTRLKTNVEELAGNLRELEVSEPNRADQIRKFIFNKSHWIVGLTATIMALEYAYNHGGIAPEQAMMAPALGYCIGTLYKYKKELLPEFFGDENKKEMD